MTTYCQDAYQLIEEHPLADLDSKGYIFRHKKSGARVAVISNDDENKVFYIGFRTPPEDSTGVAHIVEHTVLCGSKKYPVKDPFVELVKGSLNTFLNAMTFPEKTIYPIASCNDKDYQNLMSVYMDAVFHPNIYRYEEIFKQEGWHYELEDMDAPVTINGVVYNEMKGAFSSPDDVLQREILNSLFPDTTYGFESGGDPQNIPDLTYQDYLDFHSRYYHPCNSYIYLYGNMDIEEKLRWMDEMYLSHYDQIQLDSTIKKQEPFAAPREVRKKYSVSSTESLEDNTYISYNLVVGDVLDKNLHRAFEILDYALLNAPGAPLKKALLDAGIGKDIFGGFDSSIMQPYFSIVAKNTNASEKDRFLGVIHQVLEEQVNQGINKMSLLAAINSAEFRYREADFGQFPKGLLYGIDCLDSWLYDENQPFLHIEAIETYQFLKEQVKTDYFEKLISKYLLENSHASVVIIEPDRDLNVQREAALTEKLAAYKNRLSVEEKQALIEETIHLKQYQEEPSPKEDLEKIPMLTREDIKKEAAPLYNTVSKVGDTVVVQHEMFTGGINYLTLLFDVKGIKTEDIPYLGILRNVLGYVDTKSYSYGDLANEINIHTGGIYCGLGFYPGVREAETAKVTFEINSKMLYEKLPETMNLIREILLTSDLSNEKRMYEIIAQLKSRMQAMISSAGHSIAAGRARSYFSKSGYLQDATGGIAFYEVVDELEQHFEEKKDILKEKLTSLIHQIFTSENLMVSTTCNHEGFAGVSEAITAFKEVLYPDCESTAEYELPLEQKNEGFMDASQVQYVCRAGNYVNHGYSYHGALRILKVIMGYDYLWIHVRVKGGAYGCMNSYTRNGDTYFVSYRDPNLEKTNEIYDGIPAYIHEFDADERDMTKYIIGTISDLDTPMNPNAKGQRSMVAYLQQLTMDEIQLERDQILTATPQDIRNLEGLIASVLQEQNLCVIGNEETLKAGSSMFKQLKNLY